MMRSILLFILAVLLGSCRQSGPGTPAGFIDRFGSYPSPSGTMTVEVTRREKSLVDFAVVDVSTGTRLVSEYVGSDAMRWFLWWETPSRLWGYGSDIGYFKVFDFASKKAITTEVTTAMPIPQVVRDHLPTSLQDRYRVSDSGSHAK